MSQDQPCIKQMTTYATNLTESNMGQKQITNTYAIDAHNMTGNNEGGAVGLFERMERTELERLRDEINAYHGVEFRKYIPLYVDVYKNEAGWFTREMKIKPGFRADAEKQAVLDLISFELDKRDVLNNEQADLESRFL